MNSAFFKRKRQQLMDAQTEGIILLHSGIEKKVSSQEKYGFRPNKMFYYLTGLDQPNMILLLHVTHSGISETLFMSEPSSLVEAWDGKQLSINDTMIVSGIPSIARLSDFGNTLDKLVQNHSEAGVWMNMVDEQHLLFQRECNLSLPLDEIQCIHHALSILRTKKEPEEVRKIEQACGIAMKGVREIIRNAKSGVREYQLEAVHDYVMKSNGLRFGQYKTILASGQNATILHYLDNNSLINDNELILVDIDVEYEHYHCDFTRVFPSNGVFSERQKEVYTEVLNVQKRLMSVLKPGTIYGEWNAFSKKLIAEACTRLGLTKSPEQYYFHNVGHAIGLDTHDVSELVAETVIEEGMVLTVEPGLYIKEEGIGIRIEDIVLIEEGGAKNLTEDMEKEIDDIEQLMIDKESDFLCLK